MSVYGLYIFVCYISSHLSTFLVCLKFVLQSCYSNKQFAWADVLFVLTLIYSLLCFVYITMWQGKDALLNALSALCTSCHKAISASDPDAPKAILSLISSACTKKAQKYREAAFCCLEQVNFQFYRGKLSAILSHE